MRTTRLIAEYKRRSPFDGELTSESIETVVRRYEASADMVSIVVEAPWGGEYEDIAAAAAVTRLPILAKGLHVDGWKAVNLGASAVLTYRRPHPVVPSYVECHTADEITAALRHKPRTILINNRDLDTGEVDLQIAERLAELIPDNVWAVAASGYGSTWQAPSRYDAVLIGTALLT